MKTNYSTVLVNATEALRGHYGRKTISDETIEVVVKSVIADVVEPALPKPTVEQREGPGWSEPFRFRLVSADGKRETNWVGYTDIAYLDGWAVATDYYLGDGTKLEPMRADEMLAATATGTCTDKQKGSAA